MKPNSADILVTNGTVLTLDAGDTEIYNGAVAIDKDTIAAVAPADKFGGWSVSKIIDAHGGTVSVERTKGVGTTFRFTISGRK